jgi:hypothetical protein
MSGAAGAVDDGTAVAPPPPLVRMAARSAVTTGTSFPFHLVFNSPAGMDATSADGQDVVVTGPRGFSAAARPTRVTVSPDGTRMIVACSVAAPGSSFDRTDNGVYTVSLRDGGVADSAATAAPPGPVGRFRPLSRNRYLPPRPVPAPALPISNTATAGALRVTINSGSAWCDHMPGNWPGVRRQFLILGGGMTNTSDAPLEVRLSRAFLSFEEGDVGTATDGVSVRGRDGRASGEKTIVLQPGESRAVRFRGDGLFPEDSHGKVLYVTLEFSAGGETAAVRNSYPVRVTE